DATAIKIVSARPASARPAMKRAHPSSASIHIAAERKKHLHKDPVTVRHLSGRSLGVLPASCRCLFSAKRARPRAQQCPRQEACREKSGALEQAELAAREDGCAPLNTYSCRQRLDSADPSSEAELLRRMN